MQKDNVCKRKVSFGKKQRKVYCLKHTFFDGECIYCGIRNEKGLSFSSRKFKNE